MAIDSVGFASTLAQVNGPPAPGAERDAAGQAFESYMLEMMVREMRKTIPEGIFQSAGMDLFAGLFDQAVAKEIAEGGGFGLAQRLDGSREGAAPGALLVGPEPGCAAATCPRAPFAEPSLPVDGMVTSGFGYRVDPFGDGRRFHKGVDIAAPVGTPIHALEGGVVRMAESHSGLGRVVLIEHEDGWRSLYAHCERLDVEPGQRVERGQPIATVGSSGRSTGPHVHLELHHEGRSVDPAASLGW